MQHWRPNAPPYIDEVLQHEGYSAWWAQRTLLDYTTITFPSIFLMGWYDIFTRPNLESFWNYQLLSAPEARGRQQAIIGPRGHCLFFKRALRHVRVKIACASHA